MFDFIGMMSNHEDRVVANYEEGELIVDTALVTDGEHIYETAIQHPEYNKGKWVVVEAYDDTASAQAGHEKWVKIMTADALPDELSECMNSGISQLGEAFGLYFKYKREEN